MNSTSVSIRQALHRLWLLICLVLVIQAPVHAQEKNATPAILHLLLSDDNPTPTIRDVFFAQTHVQRARDNYYGLVRGRDTLIKVQITSPTNAVSPPVSITLELNGKRQEMPLTGPENLPRSFNGKPGRVQHRLSDSFTSTIDKSWIQPGLVVTVDALDQRVIINDLKIGAPTTVNMTMFDAHFFTLSQGDYPAGWQEELESKWPVATLNLERVPNVVFSELVVPARAGAPHVKVDSKQSYKDQTGLNFDGEQATAAQWNRALQRAAGRATRTRLYYTNIYGVASGGQAGGFAGVGNGRSIGILHHELGHALSLPHWGNNRSYPYKGDQFGIAAPDSFRKVHAGPTWAYDSRTGTFIPPTVQANSIAPNSTPRGIYKRDPMQGGGTGDQERGFVMRHFSDYSVNQMRNYLEGHVAVWRQELGRYALWSRQDNAYTRLQNNNGVQYPIDRDVEVVSLMAAVSGSLPSVNMVYPVIGPYKADLIQLFDPNIAADRQEAREEFCPKDGCDVTFRVTQNGVIRTYMLPVSWLTGLQGTASEALTTAAINLPALNGAVSKVELLLTPEAQTNGLPTSPQVIAMWQPGS